MRWDDNCVMLTSSTSPIEAPSTEAASVGLFPSTHWGIQP